MKKVSSYARHMIKEGLLGALAGLGGAAGLGYLGYQGLKDWKLPAVNSISRVERGVREGTGQTPVQYPQSSYTNLGR